MSRIADWMTRRCRTRLDVIAMFGMGYLLGANAAATWWGRTAIVACAVGVTDMAAARIRRLARRAQPDTTGDPTP